MNVPVVKGHFNQPKKEDVMEIENQIKSLLDAAAKQLPGFKISGGCCQYPSQDDPGWWLEAKTIGNFCKCCGQGDKSREVGSYNQHTFQAALDDCRDRIAKLTNNNG
jgi:hypothetical protein